MGRSYSLHVSSKKHALTNRQSISGVYNHNYRKYLESLHYNKNQIIELVPNACKTFKEFKQVFNNHFKTAVNEYNSKQTKKERIIKDYFNKVENDLKKDVAVEIIIQVADMNFWKENENKRDLMNQVFKEQLGFLKQEVPELLITNATIHQDETSPHMHVIAIPVGYGFKQGMTMQCSKTRVFTQNRLLRLQEVMRENAEMLMQKYISQDFKMDEKQKGRNHDYTKEEYIALKKSEELRNEVKSELKQNDEIKNQVIAELNNEKIKELAKERGVSIRQIEEKLGFGNGTLNRWRTIMPSIDKVQKVSDYFNVSIDYLLDLSAFRNEEEIKRATRAFLTGDSDKEYENTFFNSFSRLPDNDKIKIQSNAINTELMNFGYSVDFEDFDRICDIFNYILELSGMLAHANAQKNNENFNMIEDFSNLFSKFNKLGFSVIDYHVGTNFNFYERLVNFDEEALNYYRKNKDF